MVCPMANMSENHTKSSGCGTNQDNDLHLDKWHPVVLFHMEIPGTDRRLVSSYQMEMRLAIACSMRPEHKARRHGSYSKLARSSCRSRRYYWNRSIFAKNNRAYGRQEMKRSNERTYIKLYPVHKGSDPVFTFVAVVDQVVEIPLHVTCDLKKEIFANWQREQMYDGPNDDRVYH